jgi:hypothetical protein
MKMKTKILIYLTILSIFIHKILSIHKYYRILKPGEIDCILEYFSDRTLVIYDLKANSTDIQFKVFDPEEHLLHQAENTDKFKYPFTTFNGGYYKLCSYNNNKEFIKIEYKLKFGITAKDYSELSKRKDLKPVDIGVKN